MNNEYIKFVPLISEEVEEREDNLYFVFWESKLLVKVKNDEIVIPCLKDIKDLQMDLKNPLNIGTYNGQNCIAVQISEDIDLREDLSFREFRSLIPYLQEDMFFISSRGLQILTWNRSNKFCGRCGALLQLESNDKSKTCRECGLTVYPRISPAIIVAVVKDDEILLANNKRFIQKMYSVIAGFVEPGETLEQCVMREVYEETGIMIKNIKYFGSQPWPFPDSLMVGFTAEYAGGDIKIDKEELTHAAWFKSNELPNIPSGGSIASRLIKWFIENK
jgi:NAD+ diphosphatase